MSDACYSCRENKLTAIGSTWKKKPAANCRRQTAISQSRVVLCIRIVLYFIVDETTYEKFPEPKKTTHVWHTQLEI